MLLTMALLQVLGTNENVCEIECRNLCVYQCRTRIVAVPHVSNILGEILDVPAMMQVRPR